MKEGSIERRYKKSPESHGKMSRHDFLKSMLVAGVAAHIPFLTSCGERPSKKEIRQLSKLSNDQLEIVRVVQDILFPSDGNGPGANDVEAHYYLDWVVSDPRMDAEDSEYIIDGIGWVDETAQEDYSKGFLSLSGHEQEDVIRKISKEGWGEDWLSTILNYIFEALLSDPLYGGNPKEAGWKWLEVYPGYPRPDKSLLYPEILKTVITGG